MKLACRQPYMDARPIFVSVGIATATLLSSSPSMARYTDSAGLVSMTLPHREMLPGHNHGQHSLRLRVYSVLR